MIGNSKTKSLIFVFKVDGVNYTYNIESSQWLADGKLLASTSDSAETYKDENGTLYFWNSVKKLWVSEAGMTYDPVTWLV